MQNAGFLDEDGKPVDAGVLGQHVPSSASCSSLAFMPRCQSYCSCWNIRYGIKLSRGTADFKSMFPFARVPFVPIFRPTAIWSFVTCEKGNRFVCFLGAIEREVCLRSLGWLLRELPQIAKVDAHRRKLFVIEQDLFGGSRRRDIGHIHGNRRENMAVGQNQWYHFGVGEFTTHFSLF